MIGAVIADGASKSTVPMVLIAPILFDLPAYDKSTQRTPGPASRRGDPPRDTLQKPIGLYLRDEIGA